MKFLSTVLLACISAISFSQSLGESRLILDYRINNDGYLPGLIHSDFILPGDFDNDGLTDFVNIKVETLKFNKNLGFGDFQTPLELDVPFNSVQSNSSEVNHFALDIDQNGNLDILKLDGSNSFLLLGNGDGTFVQAGIPFVLEQDLSLYDVGNDGSVDVIYTVTTEDNEYQVWGYLNNLDGTFSAATLTDVPFTLPSHDIDGDGDLDVFTESGEDLVWLEYEENELVTNHVISPIPDELSNGNMDKIKTDFDQDGDVDLIISGVFTNVLGLWIYENTPDGFVEHAYVPENQSPEPFFLLSTGFPQVVDLDADGDLDVYYSTVVEGAYVKAMYVNDGDLGNMSVVEISGPPVFSRPGFWHDVDGDGDMDLLAAGGDSSLAGFEQNGGQVFWYPNDFINLGCTDSEACNYNAQAISDENYCFYETGCPYADVDTFNDNAQCIDCGYEEGCLDESALNFNPEADILDINSCEYLEGCTDPCSSNFNPEAVVEDGSCDDAFVTYGCTYANAINYNTEPGFCVDDDGSCQFEVVFQVFIDLDSDGDLDTNEVGLANQSILIEALDMILFTDELGQTQAVLPSAYLEYELLNPDAFPYNTTLNPVEEHTSDSMIYFGVTPEINQIDIDVSFISLGQGYTCDEEQSHFLCVRNEGYNSVNAEVQIHYDSLFQFHLPHENLIEEGENFMVLQLDSLEPFVNYTFDFVNLHSPTVDHIGEFLETEINTTAFLADEVVAQDTNSLVIPVLCAYDPNDKIGFPLGYTDSQYIENSQEIEYLVRFQNTGNAPATDVRILDEIDEHLDLSTFKVIGNSHHVQTCVNLDTREVDFFFENIMLPDSVNNEPESHGFVVFSILPHENLAVDTEIENTARIYFDNNPPIITNTTYYKIWGCELMTFETGADSLGVCVGDDVNLIPEYQFVEDYSWAVNTDVTSNQSLEFEVEDESSFQISVSYSNPYCEAESTIYVEVLGETPVVPFVEEDQFGLVTENSSELTYQWFLDGEPITGATQYFLNPSGISGVYQVEITNINGCSTISDAFDLDTFISDLESSSFKLYPNPAADFLQIDFPVGEVNSIGVYSLGKQKLREYSSLKGTSGLTISLEDLPKGIYFIRLQDEENQTHWVKFVVT